MQYCSGDNPPPPCDACGVCAVSLDWYLNRPTPRCSSHRIIQYEGRLVDWQEFYRWVKDGRYPEQDLNRHDSRCLYLVDEFLDERLSEEAGYFDV